MIGDRDTVARDEALSNVARHAGARRAGVDVTTGAQGVTLEVHDDGVGIRVPA